MKIEKIREMDVRELELQDREIQEQLFHLKFKMGMGQLDGLKKYRALKKQRAQVLTVLRERQLAEARRGN
jgi:large subunit ribosomal protein L29